MKITELVLQTSNLSALHHFYKNTLQLNAGIQAADQLDILTPGTKLIFKQADRGMNPTYHFAFNIPCNKIYEAQAWLQHRVELLWMDDYKSDIADFVNWHAKSVYFLDAAGNVVELIARFDLDDAVTASFSPSQISNVSEIGLVFNAIDFDLEVTSFLEKNSFKYFDKQPPLKLFRAIGDDDGLLICVPENRAWFPTNEVLAYRMPLKLQLLSGGRMHCLEF